jgi:NAD(P)-dependent dehydrogenase (short-subunit alcohol dehydrogenase family)
MILMSKNLFDLTSKVALITGGSRGLGRIFCEAMAEYGCNVAFSYKTNEAGARETESILKKHGVRTLAVKADVAIPEDVKNLFKKVDQEFGKLDILFNNAGITTPLARIHEMKISDWNDLMSVNLTGVFLCMQEGIKIMLRQKKGSIINIASICGVVGFEPEILANSNYVTSKAGVIGLTMQGAVEYGPDNIRVNVIAPGFHHGTDLGGPQDLNAAFWKRTASIAPMRRNGKPEELKGLAIYLASDASSFVTGATYVHDGGWTIK